MTPASHGSVRPVLRGKGSQLDLVAADAAPVVKSHRRCYGVGWNHNADDTASAGSPQLPIFVPLPPFQPFPLPIQSPRAAAWSSASTEHESGAPPKPVLLWPKQPGQGRQAGKRGCCSIVYCRPTSPRQLNTQGVEVRFIPSRQFKLLPAGFTCQEFLGR